MAVAGIELIVRIAGSGTQIGLQIMRICEVIFAPDLWNVSLNALLSITWVPGVRFAYQSIGRRQDTSVCNN